MLRDGGQGEGSGPCHGFFSLSGFEEAEVPEWVRRGQHEGLWISSALWLLHSWLGKEVGAAVLELPDSTSVIKLPSFGGT